MLKFNSFNHYLKITKFKNSIFLPAPILIVVHLQEIEVLPSLQGQWDWK